MSDRRNHIADVMRERIISGLHLGTTAPGARIPSTRELAREFGVSPRTVMAAYRLLAAEGMLELRERSGIYVAAGTGGSHTTILSQLSAWVVALLLDARSREIPPIEFPERVRRCLETLRLRAVCVAGNTDQLDQVSRELMEDYGIESTEVFPEQLAAADADSQRALAQADMLVTTAAYTTRVEHLGRRLGKPVITVMLRRELMTEMTRHLERGAMYIIGSDPRFRQAVHAVFDPAPHGAHARAVILGEDDLSQIPADAPTYIMRRAHAQLGDDALARRVVPLRRVFATEIARDLLTFVVRANMAALATR